MKRQPQLLLIGSTLAFSWLAMQAVHEFGHVAAALLSGGQVEEVILYPTAISYTRIAANPNPRFVTWMGPIIGVMLPIAALAAARAFRRRWWYLLQFFAGFCLVANGAYLAFGSVGGIGDAGDLLRHGTPPWLLWLFGVVTIPVGVWLWNGLGPHFGLGTASGQVDPVACYCMVTGLAVLIALELLFSSPAVKL